MDLPYGGRNLEMVRTRWTHVGATWSSTNNARRTSGGHILQTRGQIRALVIVVRKLRRVEEDEDLREMI
jgi:hypothetical protein